jgi:hypothetical protein
MRALIVAALVTLVAACSARHDPRDATIQSTGELATRTVIGGPEMLVEIETTGGARRVVTHEVGLPLQPVWRAMVPAFEEVGLRGAGVMDADRRVFGYPSAVMPRRLADNRLSTYLDCGQGPAGNYADIYRVTGTVIAAVRPAAEPDRTLVEVAVEAVARPREVSGQTVRCSSNGRLERRIAQSVMMHALGSPR